MPVDNDKFSGNENTIKKIESAQGGYKSSVPSTDVETRLPTQQLPKAPDPSPFKIKGS